jgi:nicotinamidase-related amidase
MRLDPATSLLCVVDIQERLTTAAGILGVRAMLTEQYPRGLGATPPELAGLLPAPIAKMAFSCCGSPEFAAAIPADVATVVVVGFETHVCIAQTALDLLARGLDVCVATDAVATRHAVDHETALRRLEGAGAVPVTSESLIFEWCGSAEHPRFQDLRRLVL